ncbi:hypothetical protein RhiirB3_451167 [Rhizophagus irregularis]|nr:hypothetical protein RhiirB3_451167 [Rhizophagus irregularis]
MQIDSDPHYEVVFERCDQVRIGKELTDSNFMADIAIGTPGEHDYASFLTAHSQTIQNILWDERNRLGSIKEYVNELNFEGIEFPVQADEVILRRFERQNPTIALCICEWRDHRLCPIYVTDRDDAEGRKIIDLVLISNGEKQHYCWIKNMSRLVNKRTKDGHATFVCRWCISHFTHQQEIHDKHVAICRGLKKTPQADRMPSVKKGNDIYEFKNWKRRMQLKNCLKYANLKCEL